MSFMEIDHRDFLTLEELDQQVREAFRQYRNDRHSCLKLMHYQSVMARYDLFKEEHNLGFLNQSQNVSMHLLVS